MHTDTACNVLSPYSFLRGADGRMIPDSFLAYREVHATMLANGDEKPIWMTELSWRTTDATCQEGAWAGKKPRGRQRGTGQLLSQAYHCLAQDPYVQVALWFPLKDEGAVLSGLSGPTDHASLRSRRCRPTCATATRSAEPCGVFTGPKIGLLSPANRVKYSGPLPIHVYATSPNGVFRIVLKIDGKTIRSYGGDSRLRSSPACCSGRAPSTSASAATR